MTKINNIFRRLFKLLIFVAIIGGLLMAGAWYLEEDLKEKVRVGMQKVLIQKVDTFNLELSFVKHFPNPSVCISDLMVIHENEDTIRPVLIIRDAFLKVNLLEVLKGNYTLKEIAISDAHLHFYTNEEGENIRIFQNRDVSDPGRPKVPDLFFQEISLENICLRTDNDYKRSKIAVHINDAELTGDFRNDKINLKADINSQIDSLWRRGKGSMHNTNLRLQTDYEFDLRRKVSSFDDGILTFLNATFELEGTLTQDFPKGNIMDFALTGKDDFQTLIGFMPDEVQGKLKQINPQAETVTNVNITGLAGPKARAQIAASVEVKDATVVATDYDVQLDSLQFMAHFTNGSVEEQITSEIKIKDFKGYLNDRPIIVEALLTNLDTPSVDVHFDLEMDLKDLQKFFPVKGVKELGGDMTLKGAYHSTPSEANSQMELDGLIKFNNEDVVLERDGFDFKGLKGEIVIKDSLLSIDKIEGNISDIPFTLKGGIKNVYRLFLENEKNLSFDFDIYSRSINLNAIFVTLSDRKAKKRRGKHPLDFPSYVQGNINLQAPRLKYKGMIAQQVNSRISLKGNRLRIPKLELDVLHGHLSLNAHLFPLKTGNYELRSHLKIRNINTKQLLKSYNNFDQRVLTARNIEGRLNASVQLTGQLDKELKYLDDQFTYYSTFSLKDAELIDFEPVTKAVKNFRKKARSHIKVDHLEGKAIYERGDLVIPNIHFTSNLTDVRLCGNRSANEQIDFYFEFSLMDLLFGNGEKRNKRRKNKKKKSKKAGNLHLALNGLPGALKVSPKTSKAWNEERLRTKREFDRERRKDFSW